VERAGWQLWSFGIRTISVTLLAVGFFSSLFGLAGLLGGGGGCCLRVTY
jgi:hypothetical protein